MLAPPITRRLPSESKVAVCMRRPKFKAVVRVNKPVTGSSLRKTMVAEPSIRDCFTRYGARRLGTGNGLPVQWPILKPER
jgi:hypothetical protein